MHRPAQMQLNISITTGARMVRIIITSEPKKPTNVPIIINRPRDSKGRAVGNNGGGKSAASKERLARAGRHAGR